MPKRTYKRSEAIQMLNELQKETDYLEREDLKDYGTLNNDELEAELCLSGLVHDDDMECVVDDET